MTAACVSVCATEIGLRSVCKYVKNAGRSGSGKGVDGQAELVCLVPPDSHLELNLIKFTRKSLGANSI